MLCCLLISSWLSVTVCQLAPCDRKAWQGTYGVVKSDKYDCVSLCTIYILAEATVFEIRSGSNWEPAKEGQNVCSVITYSKFDLIWFNIHEFLMLVMKTWHGSRLMLMKQHQLHLTGSAILWDHKKMVIWYHLSGCCQLYQSRRCSSRCLEGTDFGIIGKAGKIVVIIMDIIK